MPNLTVKAPHALALRRGTVAGSHRIPARHLDGYERVLALLPRQLCALRSRPDGPSAAQWPRCCSRAEAVPAMQYRPQRTSSCQQCAISDAAVPDLHFTHERLPAGPSSCHSTPCATMMSIDTSTAGTIKFLITLLAVRRESQSWYSAARPGLAVHGRSVRTCSASLRLHGDYTKAYSCASKRSVNDVQTCSFCSSQHPSTTHARTLTR